MSAESSVTRTSETNKVKGIVMKRLKYTVVYVGLLLLLVAFPLYAQQAEVTRNVNLRADPSSNNPSIKLLMPPEQVQLLEPDKTAGYYHVKTSSGEQGWVWSRNLNVLETTSTPTPSSTTTPTPELGAVSTPPAAPSSPAAAVDQIRNP